MKLLITGSESSLAQALISFCKSETGVTLYTSSRTSSSRKNHVVCDLNFSDQIDELVNQVRPTHVIHLAASYQNNLLSDLAINALSAASLASSLSRLNKGVRLLLAGSATEYGVPSTDLPVSENHSLRPLNLYGLTKAIQTQIGFYYADTKALDVITARIFNILGPNMSERLFIGAVEKQLKMYKSGQISALTLGSLDSYRDYIDVEEVAKVLILLVCHGDSGKVYNVGSGSPTRMESILEGILANAGLENVPILRNEVQGRSVVPNVPCIYADITQLSLLRASKDL